MATTDVPRTEVTHAGGASGEDGREGDEPGRGGAAASGEPVTRTVEGASLARGPALALGAILLVAGLYFLYRQHGFPRFADFPDGRAPLGGKALGIFGVNGWTGELTAAAGGLLLLGAAQHLLAKAMSLIVAVALGAAAIVALISGDVLGLAAANHWTELGWAAIAAILLFNTVVPRRRRTITEHAPAAAPAATPREERATRREERATPREEPVTRREDPVDEGRATAPAARETETAAHPDGQTAAHPDGQTAAHPDEQTAAHPDEQTATGPDERTAAHGGPAAAPQPNDPAGADGRRSWFGLARR